MKYSTLAVFVCFLVGIHAGIAMAGPEEVTHVGVQLHLRPGPAEETYLRHIRAFVEEDMADYGMAVLYSLNDDEREQVAQYFKDHGVYFMVQGRFQLDRRVYDRNDFDRLRAVAGDLFLGLQWGELDSSGLAPEAYLPAEIYENPTRRRVKEAFVQTVRTLVDDARSGLGVPIAHTSGLLYHHLFAEAGVDILSSEIGENTPNANMMLALNRGTARAYGLPWMIDFSTWWSPRGNAGIGVTPREGHTPWLAFTALLDAAMGGADYIQLEHDCAAYPEEGLRGPGTGKPGPLLPWGYGQKTLYAMTRLIGPKGETDTPLCRADRPRKRLARRGLARRRRARRGPVRRHAAPLHANPRRRSLV